METEYRELEDEVMPVLCQDINSTLKRVYGETTHFALSVIEETEEDSDEYIITNFASFSLDGNRDCIKAVAESLLNSKDEVFIGEQDSN